MFAEAQDDVPEVETIGFGGMFANPINARVMRPMMRIMMNGMMKVTEHNNDCTQKEVSDFMVPESVGKKFKDKPGTFKEGMKGRVRDTMMCGMVSLSRRCPKPTCFSPRTFRSLDGHGPPRDEEAAGSEQ